MTSKRSVIAVAWSQMLLEEAADIGAPDARAVALEQMPLVRGDAEGGGDARADENIRAGQGLRQFDGRAHAVVVRRLDKEDGDGEAPRGAGHQRAQFGGAVPVH